MASSTERSRTLKERRAAEGLVQCNVWLPRETVAEFVRAAELIKKERDLRLARLMDLRTGRMRGLR
jgi:hypothetical protein